MKKSSLFFFCLLLSVCAWTQDTIIIINPDSAHVEASATQAQIEVISSISNLSEFELQVDWQWNSIELPEGWDIEFCENNGCFSPLSDTLFSLSINETVPLSAIFYPNEIPGTGKVKIRLYSASPGIHFEEKLTIIVTATGSSSTLQIEDNTDVSIFPNPANEILNITMIDKTLSGKWQVIDSWGRIIPIQQKKLTEMIRVDKIPAGQYYLRLLSSENKTLAVKPFSVVH
jgi:hypothetical protein